MDLLPGWESQHLESGFSVHNQIIIPEWEENNYTGNSDRIVSLCLRPGENRLENIHAVLQPLLAGVWGNGQKTSPSDIDEGRNKIEKDKYDDKNDDKNNDGSESESEGVNGSWNDVGECSLDNVECSIAEDMRITVHSWSRPLPTSTSTSSPRATTNLTNQTNTKSDELNAEYFEELGGRNQSPRCGFSPFVLTKNSSLLRDFLGPLKPDEKKQKLNPYPPCEMTCKLLTEEISVKNCTKKMPKNGISKHGNIGDYSYTNTNSVNSLPPSLSLPLTFNFQYNPTVVAYRLDVETLARNSTNTNDKNKNKNTSDVHSQLYLRR